MNYYSRALVFVFFVFSAAAGSGAALKNTGYQEFAVWVDGVPVGAVKSLEGGGIAGQVVNEPGVGSAPAKKHITSVGRSPVTLQIGFNLTAPVRDWINDFCAGGSASKALQIIYYDFNGAVTESTRYAAATLTDVSLPAFSGASKDAAYLTLGIAPGTGSVGASQPMPPVTGAIPASAGNFRVRCGSFPSDGIAEIQALTIKRGAKGGPTEFSNLVLSVDRDNEAPWQAWRDSFLSNGQSSDANEQTVSLDILSAPTASAPVLITVQMSQAGLVRTDLQKRELNSDKIPRRTIELYFEGFALVQPSVGKSGDTTSPTAPGAPALTAAPLGTAQAARPDAFPAVRANPDDKGAKDPANFPRPDGIIRKSFSSVQTKAALQEIAIYQASDPVDGLEQYYAKTLGEAGWTMVSRFEDNNGVGATHQIGSSWKRDDRSAAITLNETKKGLEITVKVASTVTP